MILLIALLSVELKAKTSEFVSRAIVTSSIENKEPTDEVTQVTQEINKVYFFTEVLNKANTHVTHRWLLNGKLEAEVVLKIGSDRWRTYSSKNLVPEFHMGNWQVEVIDEQNNLLASAVFSY
jgi:hypothetical protein